MNNEINDQIEIKKLLKIRRTKLIKGKRNIDTLILTLKPIFPNIEYNPNNSSNALIGRIRLSLVIQNKTQYINVGVDRLALDQYLGRIPIENGEIDFVDLETEVKKAEHFLAQWLLAKLLIKKFKSDVDQSIRENLKSVKKNNIEVSLSSKCKINTAKTANDVYSTLTIKGHLTKEQIERIISALAKPEK